MLGICYAVPVAIDGYVRAPGMFERGPRRGNALLAFSHRIIIDARVVEGAGIQQISIQGAPSPSCACVHPKHEGDMSCHT
jgi:hypothetical protein